MSEEMNGNALARVLSYIDEERDKRCQHILKEAEDEAEQHITEANARARELVHHAVTTEKQRRDRELQRMRAEVRMRLRRTWFALMRRELEQARPELHQAIIRHWKSSAENRRAWLSSTINMAATSLGPGLWHLNYPARWDFYEGEEIFSNIQEKHPDLQIKGVPSNHEAGFLITCSDVSVSTTLDGLFAQETRIVGLWLSMLSERDVLVLPPLNEEIF
jgi:hypothetical protein